VEHKYKTFEEAAKLKRKMPKSAVAIEFESYLKNLPKGQVGEITLNKNDVKPNAIKARLVRAAKTLGIGIEMKRVENVVQYWRKGEKPHQETGSK
jgi:hypothetical protein